MASAINFFMIFSPDFKILIEVDCYGLFQNIDVYDSSRTSEIVSRFGIYIVKHCSTFVSIIPYGHYYASTLLALGVPDKYAMKRMGHATPHMLKNVYQHRFESKDADIGDKITAYFQTMQHATSDDKEKTRKSEK